MKLNGYTTPYEQYEDYKRAIIIYLAEYITFIEKSFPAANRNKKYDGIIISADQIMESSAGYRFCLSREGRKNVEGLLRYIEIMTDETDIFLPFERLSKVFCLDQNDKLVVMTGFLSSFDPDIKRMCGYISGGISFSGISLAEAARIFLGNDALKMYSMLKGYIPMLFDIDAQQRDFSLIELKTSKRTSDFLLGIEFTTHFSYLATYGINEQPDELYGRKEETERIYKYLSNGERIFLIEGEEHSGKLFLAKHIAIQLAGNLVIVDAEAAALTDRQTVLTEIKRAVSFQSAYAAVIANKGNTGFSEEELADIAEISGCLFIICEKALKFKRIMPVKITLKDIPYESKFAMLIDAGISSENAEKILSSYNLYPGQLREIIRTCKKQALSEGMQEISINLLESACLDTAQGILGGKSTRISTKFTFDDLILPESEIQLIREGIDHIRYRRKVYETWDFKSKAAYGRGLSMLFEGPPGTGKTMAASIVGNELGLAVFKIDISKMMSKYIGDTEKSLGEVFDIARKNNVILFFDETDAIFSKRSEIKDSHDKYANVETSFLLQKLEEYDGIVIMTTNFKQNIDDAFMRRISYVIHFPFPEAEERKKLWKSVFPKAAELECGIDFDFLGDSFSMSGAMIKDCAISAAFLAAAENRCISMRDILRSVKKQFMKFGKTVSKIEFGIYADMYDGK